MKKKVEEKSAAIDIEIKLFLEAIYLKSGYDFREYAPESVKRRILRRLAFSGFENISAMQHRVLNDNHFLELLLQDFSINVTQMFRDASFYKALRKSVLPVLKEKPFIKIWHAGCSTGEEVYSMAILLKEKDLYENSRIYATDSNIDVIHKAKKGIYSLDRIKEYTAGYQRAGGKGSFADYYTASYDMAIMNNNLKKNIIFSDHNLVTDFSFGEMDLIMCRNVMIYFSMELQNKVISLFLTSLKKGGFLCLGAKETIAFSSYSEYFENFIKKEKIFMKK
ncbi:MAG: chemotaxis protein CheR [Desulfobacula sp. GWF2_41_7]|nr:MAG: chemotaxis protein CheR [Desulfobacula sp. GWF2_41_7]